MSQGLIQQEITCPTCDSLYQSPDHAHDEEELVIDCLGCGETFDVVVYVSFTFECIKRKPE